MPKASEARSTKDRRPPEEPARAAAAARLRYVSDEKPGIARRRRGKGWSYHAPDGGLVRDGKTRERIASLAIPPAWTDVWICPDPEGHLQATGRDARGRKQHRYHPRWREARDATKFHGMIRFGEAPPLIRAGVEAALRKRSLSRERVLATVECRDMPGYELFQYVDEEGERRDVKAEDVNAYLEELSGEDFTAKDFRTWMGTLHAFSRLCVGGVAADEAQAKEHRVEAVDHVAEQLRNTRSVCRDFYIHPGVLDAYEGGRLCELFAARPEEEAAAHMDPAEVALLRLLREIEKGEASAASKA